MNGAQVKTNVTVSGEATEMFLLVTGMAAGKDYPIRVAAVNQMGAGPQAEAALTIDEVSWCSILKAVVAQNCD